MDGLRYTVYSIPAIPGQHHVVQYKDLRLKAIQTDPQSFSSTYEKERALNYEQWRARLQSPDKITIIAAATFQSSERLSWQHKWVGMATVLGPKVLKDFGFIPPRGLQGARCYLFVGMWVHPDHRGNGLGRRMVDTGIEWIRADGTRYPGEAQIALLQVSRQNNPAISLYGSAGFQKIEGNEGSSRDNNIWMSVAL